MGKPLVSKKRLEEMIQEGLLNDEIVEILGCSLRQLYHMLAEYGLHSNRKISIIMDEELVRNACSKAQNKSQALKIIGVTPSNANYRKLDEAIETYNIDIEHFRSKRSKRANAPRKELSNEEIFTKDSSYSKIKERILRDNLLPYACDICHQLPIWNGKKLTLILDHINGDHRDNRLENLRFVCPNCNSQLETTCCSHKNTEAIKYYCVDCGKKVSSGKTRCVEHALLHKELQKKRKKELNAVFQDKNVVEIEKMIRRCGKEGIPVEEMKGFGKPLTDYVIINGTIVTKEQMHVLLTYFNKREIARIFKISDTRIGKACRKLGLYSDDFYYHYRCEDGVYRYLSSLPFNFEEYQELIQHKSTKELANEYGIDVVTLRKYLDKSFGSDNVHELIQNHIRYYEMKTENVFESAMAVARFIEHKYNKPVSVSIEALAHKIGRDTAEKGEVSFGTYKFIRLSDLPNDHFAHNVTPIRIDKDEDKIERNQEQKQLSAELKIHRSFENVGKDHGISGNAIRKRCRKYNMPTSSAIIKRIPENEWDYAMEHWDEVKDKYGKPESKISVTKIEIEEMKKLYDSGMTAYQIGKKLGRDRKTVEKHLGL